MILKYTSIETMNREFDNGEKFRCRKITIRIIAGILIFVEWCTLVNIYEMSSLITWAVVVWISQYIGAIKYKIEKK